MTEETQLTESMIAILGQQIGIDTTTDRRDAIRTEIAGSRTGYDDLTAAATTQAPQGTRDVTVNFNPGPDTDPHNAFISLFELENGTGPLADLTVALKDNIAVGGVPLTCGSAVFADAVATDDATVVSRLQAAGATLRGKTNMDELAYAPTGETSAFGPTENPVASGRVAGGSSSGSAAAVASEQVDAALGTDTGGSVRIPASFCGLVGFKPTWGTVPLDGVIDLAYTLDHVGTLARDVQTAARVQHAIADAPADDPEQSLVEAVESPPDVESLTFGVPAEFFGDYVSVTVEATIRGYIDALADAGATVRTVSIPRVEDAVAAWNAIVNVEFATVLEAAGTPLFRRASVDASWHRDAVAGIAAEDRQFGDVVQRKAIEGKYIVQELDADPYVAARNLCRALADEFTDALTACDVLVTPTMATEPVEAGVWNPHTYSSGGDDAAPPLAVNTRPADLAGIPAVTCPAGNDGTRPIGIQFLGDQGADAAVLGVAAAFEQFRDA